jgi:hypothetical protein
MGTPIAHSARIADLLARIDEATTRFAGRLERAGDRAARADVGWSPAQVGAHVAMVNDSLASVIDGTTSGAVPAAEDFKERSWPDIVGQVPARNEAPARFVPPATVTAAAALEQLHQSVAHLRRAVSSLTPERGAYCFTNRVVGTITLYQTAEFAVAHMIRHNQQAKRILGE